MQLMESGVEFVDADFPQANRLTIHILAAIAECEAKLISERVKAAIVASKARGVVWAAIGMRPRRIWMKLGASLPHFRPCAWSRIPADSERLKASAAGIVVLRKRSTNADRVPDGAPQGKRTCPGLARVVNFITRRALRALATSVVDSILDGI